MEVCGFCFCFGLFLRSKTIECLFSTCVFNFFGFLAEMGSFFCGIPELVAWPRL